MSETPEQAARRLSASWLQKGYMREGLHLYTNKTGDSMYYKVRLKHPETGDKYIRPMMFTQSGYQLVEPKYPEGKPLYKLHELAQSKDEIVIICEGEKCVDALNKIGLLATTSGSCGSAAQADWVVLTNREVFIWPDHDAPGQRYAKEASEILLALNCTVHVIDVEQLDLPAKGDVVNWLEVHPEATSADIFALPSQMILPYSEANNEWADPQPIQGTLQPVPTFDPEILLPPVLRHWVMDEANRMPCAPDFIAVAVCVALGSVIGARCAIRPKSMDPWLVVPNLWGGISAIPSSLE